MKFEINMKLYFVATIEDLSGDISRVVGFFGTLDEAIDVIEKNKCDIHENCYKYAVIEGLEPGLYPDDLDPIFFEWIDDKYQHIERPKEWEGLCGFTIG